MNSFVFLSFFTLLSVLCVCSAPTENQKQSFLAIPVSYRDADVLSNTPLSNRNFWTNPGYRWPNGRIPYIISSEYNSSERQIILNAMAEWESKTCIRFVPRQPGEANYAEITPNDGSSSYCYCYVGRVGGRQIMKMFGECMRHAAMIHELGHLIGFNHEHQRPDRDDFINVHLQNVDPAFHYAFDKFSSREVDNLGTPYDYKSVMQYPFYAFTAVYDPNRPAMTVKDGSVGPIQNEAQLLSTIDVMKTHLYYNNCN